MRKFIMAIFSMVLVALSFAFVAPAANASTDKIGICHATGSGKYVSNEISKDGTASGHAGVEHQNGGDIIPAYSWVEDKVRYYFDGQNLDKAALLDNGCKAPADTVTASPIAPIYIPATCARQDLPYGEVIVPADKGEGVSSASTPELNAVSIPERSNSTNTIWYVSYTLTEPTEDKIYAWPSGTNGRYTFKVVPITEDPLWETDSRTGKGSCVLPDTGANDYLLPLGGAAALLILGGAAILFNRRKTA
jgi:LPXTG-motif cell wall-anchored protein